MNSQTVSVQRVTFLGELPEMASEIIRRGQASILKKDLEILGFALRLVFSGHASMEESQGEDTLTAENIDAISSVS